ncbi:MAG: hypothetical protein WC123_03950 [Bacilli bacterium]|nr:hypothetical protein [Bacilli bacterium]
MKKEDKKYYSVAKDYYNRKHHYSIYRFFRFFVKLFYRQYCVLGKENINEAGIFIANHCKIHGPITLQLYFPFKKRIWTESQVCFYKSVSQYSRNDFLKEKRGLSKIIYSILLFIPSFLLVPIMRGSEVIPVYRDKKSIIMLRKNLETIKEGISSIIFAESPEPYSKYVNKLNRGFVDAGRLVHSKIGKCPFYPIYISPYLQIIKIGKPTYYNYENNAKDEKERICNYIQDEITKMAEKLPVHQVVNF